MKCSWFLACVCFVVFVGIDAANALQPPDYRNYCVKYQPNTNVQSCESKQQAARKRLTSGVYDKSVTGTCADQYGYWDRGTVLTDWVKADQCAKKEQRRVDEEQEMRAAADRDNAAAKYLDGAAETDREYRERVRRNSDKP